MPKKVQSHIPYPKGYHQGGSEKADGGISFLMLPGTNEIPDKDWAWLKDHDGFKRDCTVVQSFALPPLQDGSPQRYEGIPLSSPGQTVSLG